MQPTILAIFLALARTSTAMCVAGVLLLLIGAWAARNDFAAARGIDKIAALRNLCFAAPLAIFGALHIFSPDFVKGMVPRYMPGRMFWVYFVGCALIAAAVSIASGVAVRWSGLFVGIMMFMFVAMLYLPSGLRHFDNRFTWTIVFRESSFGAAAWVLAATAKDGWRGQTGRIMLTLGRILIAFAAIFFGIQHFFHPMGLPVVPLQKQMPAWVPARPLIDYATGAALIAAGFCFLLARNVRTAATYLGAWILLLILTIYVPVMIGALSNTNIEVQVEGINYFADTLLFAGVILSLAPPDAASGRKQD
jgi:uncharacterized membrane protein